MYLQKVIFNMALTDGEDRGECGGGRGVETVGTLSF